MFEFRTMKPCHANGGARRGKLRVKAVFHSELFKIVELFFESARIFFKEPIRFHAKKPAQEKYSEWKTTLKLNSSTPCLRETFCGLSLHGVKKRWGRNLGWCYFVLLSLYLTTNIYQRR